MKSILTMALDLRQRFYSGGDSQVKRVRNDQRAVSRQSSRKRPFTVAVEKYYYASEMRTSVYPGHESS